MKHLLTCPWHQSPHYRKWWEAILNEVPPKNCLAKADLSGILTAAWDARGLKVLLEHRQTDSSRCALCIGGRPHVLQTPAVGGPFLQGLYLFFQMIFSPPHYRDKCFLLSVLTGSSTVMGDWPLSALIFATWVQFFFCSLVSMQHEHPASRGPFCLLFEHAKQRKLFLLFLSILLLKVS